MKQFKFPEQTNFYKGKVRDVYTIADKLIVMVASDRISAFDVILPRTIPFKGQVLNQIAAYMLRATRDICPNWLLDTPAPIVSVGKKCKPFKIEMVVRGHLTCHAWRTYSSGKRMLCGVQLPEGMRENDFFPSPIITPSTKADAGHDEDISKEEIIQQGLASVHDWEIKKWKRKEETVINFLMILATKLFSYKFHLPKETLVETFHQSLFHITQYIVGK